MQYTALIHNLLRASEEAKHSHTDVAERLKDKCVDGINIIRETLMNAVCDPRFKLHVAAIPDWRQLARKHLENFAERLLNISDLDSARAYYEMDEMLDQWLTKARTIAENEDSANVSYTSTPKDRNDRRYQHLKQTLERYVNDDEEDKLYKKGEEDDELDSLLSELSWDSEAKPEPGQSKEDATEEGVGEPSDEDEKKSPGSDRDEENQSGKGENEEENKDGNRYSGHGGSHGFGIGGGSGAHVELENRFLSNVPASLIELAKRIGRSGENVYESSSSFTSSSKSDIAGITTGDDLSSLLPSELAMLSEPATRDIFYRNFVTKRLQVFASASQGTTGKKRHDGPIIICLDTSSSMRGEPILVAKALTIAVCIIAQRRKRKVLVVKYSSNHELFRLRNIERDKRALLSFLGEAEMGGNDENEMFRWLFDEIMPNEGNFSTADVLCISDFGWMPISEEVMEKINAEKQKGMTFYGLNIGEYETDDFLQNFEEMDNYFPGSPNNVCDSLWQYSNGTCKETKKIQSPSLPMKNKKVNGKK